MKNLLPTKAELKTMIGVGLLVTVIFSSIIIYRSNVIDPQLDAAYAEIYGLNEEGNEWE